MPKRSNTTTTCCFRQTTKTLSHRKIKDRRINMMRHSRLLLHVTSRQVAWSLVLILLIQTPACHAFSNARTTRLYRHDYFLALPSTTTIVHGPSRGRLRRPTMMKNPVQFSLISSDTRRMTKKQLHDDDKTQQTTNTLLRKLSQHQQQVRHGRWMGYGGLIFLVVSLLLLLVPFSAVASTAGTSAPAAITSSVAESLVESTLTTAATASTNTVAAATTTVGQATTSWACLEAPVPASVERVLLLRLLWASLLGGCVGKERSSTHQHSAGVRTMALVALGACAFTICSSLGFSHLDASKCDPSRMASNVASGVGFVGAGVITTSTNGNDSRQSMVHGLTTATAIVSKSKEFLCFQFFFCGGSFSSGLLKLSIFYPSHSFLSLSLSHTMFVL